MSFRDSKILQWSLRTAIFAGVMFLLAMPFVVELPGGQQPAEQAKTPQTKQDKPAKYVERYKPRHHVKLPDFAAIRSVKEKKRRFFNFMRPYIDRENERILSQRIWLLTLKNKLLEGVTLAKDEQKRLDGLYEDYRINYRAMSKEKAIRQLLKSVDTLPKELVLMQAANESAWGTSRFARLGLNFFGLWCYTEGCGMVPNSRGVGKKHEVEAFLTVQDCVSRYFKNINTNTAYSLLREIRAQLRANHLQLDAQVLATGLLQYSQRGDLYVQEISKMIEHNQRYMND